MNPVQPALVPLISVFMFHFGSKYITFDLTPAQKELFKHPLMKAIILVSMFYVSTRSIQFSILLMIIYFIMMHILLNENHKYNVITKFVRLQEQIPVI